MDSAQEKEKLQTAISEGEEVDAQSAAQALLSAGVSPMEVTSCMAQVMEELGEKFHNLEIYVPDLVLASDAFEAVMDIIRPELLKDASAKSKGTVVIGVIEGDIHTLGKNLVRVMLEADHFKVHDLGRDVKAQEFIRAAKEHQADIIAISSLMTTTMQHMRQIPKLLTAEGERDNFKIIIGGAPITQSFADEIGADGYAEDAPMAVDLVNNLIKKSA